MNYISIYDDVLSKEQCYNLIEKFEKNESLHERYDNDGQPNFTQLNLSRNPEIFEEDSKLFIDTSHQILNDYIGRHGCMFPEKYGWEEIRMKRYKKGGTDRFDNHVDVTNHASARRFLVFFYYLNDVKKGGETEFTSLKEKVTPKRGSCLVFPPLWTHPHRGLPPVSNTKYIVGSYLHYI